VSQPAEPLVLVLDKRLDSAEALQSDAQQPAVVAAIEEGKNSATLSLFDDHKASLISSVTHDPFTGPSLTPASLDGATPEAIISRPWNFERAVADYILETSSYYGSEIDKIANNLRLTRIKDSSSIPFGLWSN
jgi:hypothetical protein